MKSLKSTLIGVLGGALLLLVLQNTAPVRASFLWYSAEMPAIVLLVLTALVGFALGVLVARLGRRRDPLR